MHHYMMPKGAIIVEKALSHWLHSYVFFTRVSPCMCLKIVRFRKNLVTLAILLWFLTGVSPCMCLKIVSFSKILVRLATFI